MALVSIRDKMRYKENVILTTSVKRSITTPNRGLLSKISILQGKNTSMVTYAMSSGTNEKQLRLLDSYFGKLQGNANKHSLHKSYEIITGEIDAKVELQLLNAYLGKLNKDANQVTYTRDDQANQERNLYVTPQLDPKQNPTKNKTSGASNNVTISSERFYDDTSDLYLISIVASINIAVFLFQVASPVKNGEFELFSLPLLYGAKINHLILVGEWWRLVTPMFLVQDR